MADLGLAECYGNWSEVSLLFNGLTEGKEIQASPVLYQELGWGRPNHVQRRYELKILTGRHWLHLIQGQVHVHCHPVLEDSQGCLDGGAEVRAGEVGDKGGHPVDDVQL